MAQTPACSLLKISIKQSPRQPTRATNCQKTVLQNVPPRLTGRAVQGYLPSNGEVAERLNAPVLKTGKGASPSWVRIPPSPPFKYITLCQIIQNPWLALGCGHLAMSWYLTASQYISIQHMGWILCWGTQYSVCPLKNKPQRAGRKALAEQQYRHQTGSYHLRGCRTNHQVPNAGMPVSPHDE